MTCKQVPELPYADLLHTTCRCSNLSTQVSLLSTLPATCFKGVMNKAQLDPSSKSWVGQLILSAARLTVWLSLSSGVILSNKWLLHPMRFPFPVSLTCWHMAVSAVVGAIAVRSGIVAKQQLSWKTWAKICLPVGALSAASLFFGNMSFMYLTVSFMQMLKANMPVIIFTVGCLFATEVFTFASFGIMVVIAAGVAMASYGELNFSLLGVLCMFSAMSCEAVRLTLVQTLLQRQDLQLNPLSTLYYIMPISTACLLPIAFAAEVQGLWDCTWLTYHSIPVLLINAGGAVALNLSIYIVVGTMSALTMKLAAIVKDIGLVAVSCALFGDSLTFPGILGYSTALIGVCGYNYRKMSLQGPPPISKLNLKQETGESDQLLPVKNTESDWQIPAASRPVA